MCNAKECHVLSRTYVEHETTVVGTCVHVWGPALATMEKRVVLGVVVSLNGMLAKYVPHSLFVGGQRTTVHAFGLIVVKSYWKWKTTFMSANRLWIFTWHCTVCLLSLSLFLLPLSGEREEEPSSHHSYRQECLVSIRSPAVLNLHPTITIIYFFRPHFTSTTYTETPTRVFPGILTWRLTDRKN